MGEAEPEDSAAIGQVHGVPPAPADARVDRVRPEVDAHGAARRRRPWRRNAGARRRRRRWVESRCCTDDGDELARGSHGPIAGQDVAPLGLGGTRQVDRDPTAAADPLDGRAVDLELARPNLNAGRLESERIAARQRTAAQRAGHDRPASSNRERPIHGQSR